MSRFAFLIVFLFTLSAHAQESKMKIETPLIPKGEDVDTIITNNKMRAETGSKSVYSISTSLGYSAGSMETPLSDRRPNLSGATGTTDITSLTGAVSAKYAVNSQNSVFGGVGLRWLTPLHGSGVPEGYNGNKFDVDNPYLNYQYVYRWLGVQSAMILNETFYTNTNLTRAGYVTAWSVSQNNMYDIGHSGFTIGANVYADLGYFDDNSAGAKMYQSDYSFGIVPALEYRLTDKLNLRTDSNMLSLQHVRSEHNANTYQQQHWAQTLSIGYAIKRDVYISPGLQWLPENVRADRTTTWLTANVNLF